MKRRSRNDVKEKKIPGLLFVLFEFCFVFTGSFYGCKSTDIRDNSDVVKGNSFAAGQLETTVKALDGTISSSRERVGKLIETSRGIEDGIDRLEFLFNSYESETNRLLNEINDLRNEVESMQQDLVKGENIYTTNDCN